MSKEINIVCQASQKTMKQLLNKNIKNKNDSNFRDCSK